MEQKNYYAIIPANVRYDKDLPPNAKLLYGEITALCNEKGFCWASNSYFAELYNVDKSTISRWVSKLENQRYIIVNMQYDIDGKTILNRCISISEPIDKIAYPIDKKIDTPTQKSQYPIDKIVKENNTSNNTINKKEIYKEKIPPSLDEVKQYCQERNNDVDPQKFIDFYSAKGWMIGKNKMKDWKAAVRTWEKNKPQERKYNILC